MLRRLSPGTVAAIGKIVTVPRQRTNMIMKCYAVVAVAAVGFATHDIGFAARLRHQE